MMSRADNNEIQWGSNGSQEHSSPDNTSQIFTSEESEYRAEPYALNQDDLFRTEYRVDYDSLERQESAISPALEFRSTDGSSFSGLLSLWEEDGQFVAYDSLTGIREEGETRARAAHSAATELLDRDSESQEASGDPGGFSDMYRSAEVQDNTDINTDELISRVERKHAGEGVVVVHKRSEEVVAQGGSETEVIQQMMELDYDSEQTLLVRCYE